MVLVKLSENDMFLCEEKDLQSVQGRDAVLTSLIIIIIIIIIMVLVNCT